MSKLISPHGAAELKPLFVYNEARHAALLKEAASLPSLLVNSAAAANAVMLGGGYFMINGGMSLGSLIAFYTLLSFLFNPIRTILVNIEQLFGGLDPITPTPEARVMLEAALARSRIKDAAVTLVVGANHDYMQAVTGGEKEIFNLSRFVPRHHDDVVEWAAQRFDLPPRQP